MAAMDVPVVVPVPGVPWIHSGQAFVDNLGMVWNVWFVPCVQCTPLSISEGIVDEEVKVMAVEGSSSFEAVVPLTLYGNLYDHSPDFLIRQVFQGTEECSRAKLAIPSLSSEEAIDVARGLDVCRAIMCPYANYFLRALITYHFDSVADIVVNAIQSANGGLHWAAQHSYGHRIVSCLAEKTMYDTSVEKALIAMLSSDRAKELVSDGYAWHVVSMCMKKSTLNVSAAALQLVRDEIWELVYSSWGRRLLEIAVTNDMIIAKQLASADNFLSTLEKKTRSVRLLRKAVRNSWGRQKSLC